MKFTLPKLGFGSPPGLPKLQNLIARVKTSCIGVLFISLENYQSVNVENGLAWVIWTSTAQVMAKRKVGSQTSNLTPDHKKVKNPPDPGACRLSAIHCWKALEKSYKFVLDLILIGGLSKEL